MTQQKTFAYQDMEVCYWVAGSPARQAIVFLHPAFGDHSVFQYQLAHFEKDYYVISVDMVGHGKSQPRKERVDIGHMPDIIAGILDMLGIEKVHLVGVSLGSIVVQAVAHAYPARAASVTVVGGYSIHKDNKQILKLQRREIVRWVFHMLASMEKFKAHMVSVSASSEEGQAILARAASGFKRRSFLSMGGMERFFEDIDAPVSYPLLILCGRYDTPLALEAGQRLAELEPGSRFVVIENAGHCANIDNPSEFNAALEAFLNGVYPSQNMQAAQLS